MNENVRVNKWGKVSQYLLWTDQSSSAQSGVSRQRRALQPQGTRHHSPLALQSSTASWGSGWGWGWG